MHIFRRRTQLLTVLTLAVLLIAATAAPKIVRVTVTQQDGKSVAGELMETTPAGVTVKPAIGKSEPVLVTWAQIKHVSNGMTRQTVLDDWKVSHADQLCPDCGGDGTTKCDVCNGTGVDPAQAKPCDKCKGTGALGKCPKCTDGKVPCPAPCIKASDYTGKIGQDGTKMGRLFHNKDGSTFYFHDHHIGELPVQENGMWVTHGKCPTCAGTSKVICPTCHGTAKRECPTCHGAGVTGPACTAGCQAGRVVCKTCNGTGLKSPAGPTTAPAGEPGKA